MGMPLHEARAQCKLFAQPEVPQPYFKPYSALGMNQCHGLWADDDASGEDDDNVDLCFGAFFCAVGGS